MYRSFIQLFSIFPGILQGHSNGIDYNNVCKKSFFIEFGYRTQMEKNGADWFGFTDLVYKNINLDVAILELRYRKGKSYPPPINMFNDKLGLSFMDATKMNLTAIVVVLIIFIIVVLLLVLRKK